MPAKRVLVVYQDLVRARAEGEEWPAISERLGVAKASLHRIMKLKQDAEVTKRTRAGATGHAAPAAAKPGEHLIRYADVKAARATGTPWAAISQTIGGGCHPTHMVTMHKRREDYTYKPRGTQRRPKNGHSKPTAALAVVNKHLARETPEHSVYAAAQEFAQQMRKLGVQRLVIDLERNSVQMTSTETFSLPGVSA